MNIGDLLIRILNIIDVYLKLILTSWPAVILLLSAWILLQHREAINNRIKNIKSVGLDGVTMYPLNSEPVSIPNSELPISISEKKFPKSKNNSAGNIIALVSYEIASSLPGTVTFDFLKDWKVWFWIANREPKRYRAYVKIKFVTEKYEKELSEGYYGGVTAWNLNAFSGIQAPGLEIPDEIKKAANQKKKIKIEINCIVKDENDKIIEKKLSSVYAYEYEKKHWYLEP